MVTHRLIGIGTTNSNGVAHLTHDAEGQQLATMGYKGKGNGKVDIVASPDNMISNSSDVSEPSSVLDCIYYNSLTSDTSMWVATRCTATPSDDGTHFVASESGTNYFNFKINNTLHPFSGSNNLVYEFDVKSENLLAIAIRVTDDTTANVHSYSLSGWHHIKWEFYKTENKLSSYIDGTKIGDVDLSAKNTDNLGFAITDWQGDMDCWIKDFKVYPF